MEEQDRVPEKETLRREELNRLIKIVRNVPKRLQGEQPGTSGRTQKAENLPEIFETEFTNSIGSFGVPEINFKRYMGATGVRYIQMGQTSHMQSDNNWDLEKTIRKAEEKFTTNLKTIATEITNDERILKPLVCLEKNVGTNTRRKQALQETAVNEIRRGILQ